MISLKSSRKKLPFLFVVLIFVIFALFGKEPVKAAAADNLTFQWQANPTEENVTGYRLYYGPQSRYDSDGSLRENFSYPQYIDFSEQIRCSGTEYNDCETLDSQDLQCEGLYSETPRCTVYGLRGTLFLTMTAYTNIAESGFTAELESATPIQLQTVVQIIDMLLLSE